MRHLITLVLFIPFLLPLISCVPRHHQPTVVAVAEPAPPLNLKDVVEYVSSLEPEARIFFAAQILLENKNNGFHVHYEQSRSDKSHHVLIVHDGLTTCCVCGGSKTTD